MLPVDLAANARSLGAHVIEVHSRAELEQAIKEAKAAPADGGPVVIHVETDPLVHAPDSEAWWDVPVSQVAELDSTREAYGRYVDHQRGSATLPGPHEPDRRHRRPEHARRTTMSKPALIGTAPDSWGVWFPDDPQQMPWQRFLDEVAEAGYTRIELGPYGYLPTDPDQLADELARAGPERLRRHGLRPHLHRARVVGLHLESTSPQVAALTQAMGARAPRRHPGLLARRPDRRGPRGAELTAEQWARYTAAA